MAADELTFSFERVAGGKVQVTCKNGVVQFVDRCDPGSAVSRNKLLKGLREQLPAVDSDQVGQQILALASAPPPEQAQSGSAIDANPEPWPHPVDGAELLDDLCALLRRFVVLPANGAEVVALWALHTYVFDAFEYTPRLLIHSPDKRCGKSRLLRLIVALVCRPLACEGISAAALFRSIEKYQPTLLLDEADTFLRGKDVNEDLRGTINAGHQRGGRIIRCVGDDAEPHAFAVFAPMAIAMIGKPPGTVEDRSIPVAMRRRSPGENVERHAPGKPLRAQFIDHVRKCVRWAADNREALSGVVPACPHEIDDRAADCWFALLAIADCAGGRWPEAARRVAVSVMAGRDGSDSLGAQLLGDLRDLFARLDVERMSTAGLVHELGVIEERPWAEFRRGHPITPRQLARLLEPFDVAPRNLRLPGGTVAKGYFRDDFADAWSRYLAPTPDLSATSLHALFDKHLGRNQSATPPDHVADEKRRNPLREKACSGVADKKGVEPYEADADDFGGDS